MKKNIGLYFIFAFLHTLHVKMLAMYVFCSNINHACNACIKFYFVLNLYNYSNLKEDLNMKTSQNLKIFLPKLIQKDG